MIFSVYEKKIGGMKDLSLLNSINLHIQLNLNNSIQNLGIN